MPNHQIIISGAGPAGLAAAALLGQEKHNVAVISAPSHDDPRTTALMQPAIQLLKHLGVWHLLESQSSPLRRLHIVDDTGLLIEALPLEFSARELGLEEFGFNVPVALLVKALRHRASELGVHFTEGISTSAKAHDDNIVVSTEDGNRHSAKLLLVADGSRSKLREVLGFSFETQRFDQCALATSFDHSSAHDFVSTEWHKSGGPFTTVPMVGRRSSLVWMEKPQRADALMKLSDSDLAKEIQIASHGTMGLISNVGQRALFPMQSQRATRFGKSRALLVGEAAHALPPIGAQGLNLSLRDAATIADLVAGVDDPGAQAICSEYDRVRRSDVMPRQDVTRILNHSLLSDFGGLHAGRAVALSLLGNAGPLRREAMRRGLYGSGSLPYAMRA